MATYLLDTTIIIDAINTKRNRNRFLVDRAEREGHTLACWPVNVAEVYVGMRPAEERRTTDLLRSLFFYEITFPIAELAGRLKRDYSKKGTTLSLTDAMIAAVAIHNQVTLITDNVKHFSMKELSLYPLSN